MVDGRPADWVAGRIAERYAHPARAAYLYLFRLAPGADFAPLTPDPAKVITAWVDEGAGLIERPAAEAVSRCGVAQTAQLKRATSPHERRQLMARVVVFSVEQVAADQIKAELFSRALAFSPKGDRRATEIWRPADGAWYSAPVGRE